MVISAKGKALLHAIDEQVQVHVDYFNRASTPEDRHAAVSILLFYVGVSLRSPTAS
jgi:hypothetical protein